MLIGQTWGAGLRQQEELAASSEREKGGLGPEGKGPSLGQVLFPDSVVILGLCRQSRRKDTKPKPKARRGMCREGLRTQSVALKAEHRESGFSKRVSAPWDFRHLLAWPVGVTTGSWLGR